MVKTRSDLKIKIKEFVEEQTEPFKTYDVQLFSKQVSSNIMVSTQRLQNYIRQISGVKFNKSNKTWVPNVETDLGKVQGELNATKKQRRI